MSTSTKIAATIRQGGPGSSKADANDPLTVRKPLAEPDKRDQSKVSGGGGERDSHHGHDPSGKGGKS
ncbi:hypothetical protein HGP17_10225 [Rhizobium sp. P38BS-XIX]|uniref:hypothetical protein n=1 Tax=Rhizobium sp. P38BS-XIX TaxID=2726740 RepID=UPI001456A2E4|nr:hypothetical protein [Rhizobium sp. P38BS-XIX]NLR97210.1 hypothetical protein [Rhizobium sp. P38BS-XIX]